MINVNKEGSSVETHITNYFRRLDEIIKKVKHEEIVNFIREVQEVRDNHGVLYFAGNGGSAATASHYVNDFMIGTNSGDKPFKAIGLSDNLSLVTCISNDFGYDDVFLRQVKPLLTENDALICISASGNSVNLIKAVEYAKSINAITIGITAFDGGKLRKIVDHSIHVPTEKGEYGPAEDVHMILDHLVTGYLMNITSN